MLSISIFAILISVGSAQSGVFDVTAYGAIGDGKTVNTVAIASAITAANAFYTSTTIPGTVLVPAGDFLSGQVHILSGVTLSISPAGRLLGSSNVSDYPSDQTKWAFLYSNTAVNITICGGGVVDGNYRAWVGGFDSVNDEYIYNGWPGCSGECRPRLAVLSNSQRVVVANVTFTGSADWTFQLLNCTDVHVYNWSQWGDERWPNNDGIDIDSSRNVLLEDSSIDTADDGVCIKGSILTAVVANVTVRRCSVRSRSSAIKFGSNCPIPMYNLTFEDIYIHDSNRGLAIQARDGGTISNVTFQRIVINGTRFWPYKWWGDGTPLYISTMLRTAADPGSLVRNITFRNITAWSQSGAVFSGRAPGKPVQGVVVDNVTIVIDKVPSWNYSASTSPAILPNIEFDPSSVVHPTRIYMNGWASGVYAEAVEGLQLLNVNVTFQADHAQSYWGTQCVNTTAVGFPVTITGGACVPPPAM